MRFMIIRKADADTEAGVMPSEQLIEDMTSYNEELVRAGVMLDGQGLHPTTNATRIAFRNGTATFVDGPFTEVKELIAGFTIIEVKSRDEALEWVKRWPEPNVDLELRQLYTSEELGANDDVLARHDAMREATGAKL